MFREMFDFIHGLPFNDIDSYTIKRINSMARLGTLKEVSFGSVCPYFTDSGKDGEVLVPSEFESLRSLGPDIIGDMWFDGSGDSSRLRKNAFRVRILGGLTKVAGVQFLYGVTSGITDLEFYWTQTIRCRVPEGFSVGSLVNLLNGPYSELRDFIFENGNLNRAQKERILKYGL